MSLFSHTTLTTYDLGRKLQFRLIRERGWLERLISIAVATMFFWEAFRYHTLFFIAGSLLAIAAFIADMVNDNATELEIDAEKLLIHGSLGKVLSDKAQLSMSAIVDFSFEPESEDHQQGLYARTNNTKLCILPGITEGEAMEARNLILIRFPELIEQMSMNTSIFGKSSDPVTLGLSRKIKPSNNSSRSNTS